MKVKGNYLLRVKLENQTLKYFDCSICSLFSLGVQVVYPDEQFVSHNSSFNKIIELHETDKRTVYTFEIYIGYAFATKFLNNFWKHLEYLHFQTIQGNMK